MQSTRNDCGKQRNNYEIIPRASRNDCVMRGAFEAPAIAGASGVCKLMIQFVGADSAVMIDLMAMF